MSHPIIIYAVQSSFLTRAKLKSALPPEGSVRALLVTEKQYENMRVLLGDRYAEETYLDSTDLLEL